MQTVASAMRSNTRRALGLVALVLSLIVYCAGLLYAGVRSYSLFAATIAPGLLPLAVLGIVALELSALALPLALHYWTAPGVQRYIASGFYLLDLGLVVGNSILDAAHQSGTVVPEFLLAYGVYAVPALPVLCMAGWALIWATDSASREADMQAAVRAATQDALMGQIMRATESVDITAQVEAAAGEAARALVSETLGRAPRQTAPEARRTPVQSPAVPEVPETPKQAVLPVSEPLAGTLDEPDDLSETKPRPVVTLADMPRPYTGVLPKNGNGHHAPKS